MRRGGVLALAACVLLVLAAGASTVAFLGPPFYHFNDDAVMSTIVSGVGWIGGETHPSPRAVFIHLLLGRVLEALYAFRPAQPWYGAMLLGAVGLASVLIGFAALRLGPRPILAVLVASYTALVTFSGISSLHFGIAASLLAGGAALLGVSLTLRPARTIGRTCALAAASFLAALFAVMLRAESGWLGIAVVAPAVVITLRRRGFREHRPLLAGLIALALVHGALLAYERRDYAAAPGWAGTFEWMDAKRLVLDHSTIVYDARSRPAFAAAGWSANDFDQLRGWFVWDKERYSAPSLRRLYRTLRDHDAVAPASLGQGRLRAALVTPFSLAAFALALLIPGASRRVRMESALGVAWSLALLVGVAVTLRAPPARVHLPVWLLAMSVPILWHASRDADHDSSGERPAATRLTAILALVVLVASGLAHARAARAIAAEREGRAAGARRDLERLAGHRGALLLNWAGLFPVHDLLRPLEPFTDRNGRLGEFGQRSFFWLGWPTRLPINQLWLERHGIRDLYAALYERDDLLILARPEYLSFLERDLQEHRGITVGHERVMEGETVSAFRLVRRGASR